MVFSNNRQLLRGEAVCGEAVRLTILATAWLLVLKFIYGSQPCTTTTFINSATDLIKSKIREYIN